MHPPRPASRGEADRPTVGLAGQNLVLERIAVGAPLGEVLGEIVRLMTEEYPDTPSSILLVDDAGLHLLTGAAAPAIASLARACDGMPIGPAEGSCGTAAYTRRTVFVADLASDPRWDKYRHLALPLGLRSCWSVPILSRGRSAPAQTVLGTFAIYGRESTIDPAYAEVVARVEHLTCIAIESERASRKLQRSEQALQRAQEVARMGSWSYDLASGMWSGSDEFWRICGVAAGPVTAEELLARVHPDDRERVVAATRATIKGQACELEHRLLIGDDTRWLSVRSDPGAAVAGRVGSITGVTQDVTARRRLEEQLRQQQKLEAIGRLAGGIAHDFNNILTVIGGLCESLERTLPEGAHGRDDVLSIRDAGERAAALTAQLLAFSRRSIVDPAVIDVNAAIERLGGMLRRLIGEDVAVSTDLARDLAAVEADPGQLDQVLVNLVLNARDAMPGGGDVLVRTRNVVLGAPESSSDGPPAGRFVELSVKDTGVGMSDEVQARIFEPFFTTKRIGEGTGLGLATVHGIVAQARGRITVESRPGAGTTFTLLFPATERAPASRPPAEAPAPGGSETILVVEDEEPVRRLVCRALKGGGYTVIEAGSGAAALAAFDALGGGRLDLLVTDVVMPRMGGRELAELISQRCPDLRILFMSGYTDDAVLREGVSQAEVTFLQKPFTPRQLAEKVRAALSKPAR